MYLWNHFFTLRPYKTFNQCISFQCLKGFYLACVFAFICLFHNIKNQDSSGVLGFNVLCSHMVCFKLVLATEGVFWLFIHCFLIVSIMHTLKFFSPFFLVWSHTLANKWWEQEDHQTKKWIQFQAVKYSRSFSTLGNGSYSKKKFQLTQCQIGASFFLQP